MLCTSYPMLRWKNAESSGFLSPKAPPKCKTIINTMLLGAHTFNSCFPWFRFLHIYQHINNLIGNSIQKGRFTPIIVPWAIPLIKQFFYFKLAKKKALFLLCKSAYFIGVSITYFGSTTPYLNFDTNSNALLYLVCVSSPSFPKYTIIINTRSFSPQKKHIFIFTNEIHKNALKFLGAAEEYSLYISNTCATSLISK